MSIFKRLSATLVSRIDHVVGEIENHDAVIQATLSDMRKKIAEAKVRLGQVRHEQQQLKHQLQEQQDNGLLWRKRAIECAKENEDKALECLSRRRCCQQKAKTLGKTLEQYTQTADRLAQDIETSQQRLTEMKQKLTLMRARQSTSLALNATDEVSNHCANALEDSFNRWEVSIAQTEISLDVDDATDTLEQDFISQEQQEVLQKELMALLAEEEQK